MAAEAAAGAAGDTLRRRARPRPAESESVPALIVVDSLTLRIKSNPLNGSPDNGSIRLMVLQYLLVKIVRIM